MYATSMAKPKSDNTKPKSVRVRPELAAQLEILCKRNASDLTEEVNGAVRELLKREGLWPPPASPSADQ